MTSTHDITTCTDIVYGKHFRTHLSQVPVPERALLENGIRYRDSDLRRVNSALQRGTNISISEIYAKWSVFSGTVTYIG